MTTEYDEYKHTQIGHVLIIVLGLCAPSSVIVIYFVSKIEGVGPVPFCLGATMVVLLICLALFYSLTVQIKDGFLRFWFGPGLIRKKIPLGDIAFCKPVKIHWWNGWGIHFTQFGTLYNVSGMYAVAIELASGKKLAVGTDEPEKLADAINAALGS